jgi:hypothetical protein
VSTLSRLHTKSASLCLLASILLVSPSVLNGQSPLSAGIELDPVSRYVWRGIDQGMSPVLQPSVWGAVGNVTVSLWANVAAEGLTELDPGLSYSAEWLGFSLEPSFACYLFPAEPDPFGTAELSLNVARPVGPIEVFTDHSLDVVGYPGAYYGDVGVAFEPELTENLAAGTSACVGWATAQFNEECLGVRHAAVNCAEAQASLTWSPLGWLYVRPHVAASSLLDARLQAATDRPVNVTFGLAVGREF